jgi:hypothetical protein
MPPDLTPKQLDALRQFCRRSGRLWRHRLKELWDHPDGAKPKTACLLTLRESHGLEWLRSTRAP